MARDIIWTIEKIKKGLEDFYKEHNRYPTCTEIDQSTKLPSSRQIQRRFGGIPNLRIKLELKGQSDFTKGVHSSERAYMINHRAHKVEKEVHTYLIKTFGEPFVHREFFFNDDARTRTDFYVYYKGGNFSIDVFYPNNILNLNGCLNSKLKTYNGLQIEYPIIFLMMNDSISKEQIGKLLANKKNKLKDNQIVMTFDQFKVFCDSKKPRI